MFLFFHFILTLLLKPEIGFSLPCDGLHGYGSTRIESADTCYVYFTEFLPKETVESNCYEKGLQLIMLETRAEQEWLKNKLAGLGLYTTIWTAGEKISNIWSWYDGRREITIAIIDTSRISTPNSELHLILDPGPNVLTPRGQNTYHYYICETQALPQAGIPSTITTQTEAATLITTETTSTVYEEATTLEATSASTMTSSYHCQVLQEFDRINNSIQHMRIIQNETLTSTSECMVKCTKLNECESVEINHLISICSLLKYDTSIVVPIRDCSSSSIVCYKRL